MSFENGLNMYIYGKITTVRGIDMKMVLITISVLILGLFLFLNWNYVDDDVRRILFEKERAWDDEELKQVKEVYVRIDGVETLLTNNGSEIQALLHDLKYKMATNQYWLVRKRNGDFIPFNEGGWELRFKTDEYEDLAASSVKYSPKGDVVTFNMFFGEVATLDSSEILKDLLRAKRLLLL
jgi:hypothetical protein